MVSQEAQKIACPAILRKRLEVFRVGSAEEPGYFVKDTLLDESHTFQPWQFFVLEVLVGCADVAGLSSVFEDRFGKPLVVDELEELLRLVEEKKWFSVAAIDHPILSAFKDKKLAESRAAAGDAGSGRGPTPAERPPAQADAGGKGEPLPPGVLEVAGLDGSVKKWSIRLFNPRLLLRLLGPILSPFRFTVYLLPLLLIAAGVTVTENLDRLIGDLDRFRSGARLLEHLLFSMVTVNLLTTWAVGLVAQRYRATVNGFCIVFHFGVLPRFMMRIGNARQLSRRERVWLHATPLLVRLTLCAVGILMWFNASRLRGDFVSIGLALAVASAISFLITANPLIKSSGYHLVSAWLDQPLLRGKSFRALIGRFRGGTYQQSESNVLAAYGLASAVFLLVVVIAFLFLLGRAFQFHWGGPSLIVLLVIAAGICWGLVGRLKEIDRVYHRTAQFDRWRKRTLPTGETEPQEKHEGSRTQRYVGRVVLILVAAAMFLPYTYEPGGAFTVLPELRQELTSPLSGLVEEIYFDGGEHLQRGTVIGRLSDTHDAAQVKILQARIAEQEAVIAELKARPLPEEVLVAESNMRTEETRAEFSAEKLERMEKLFGENTVSLEDIEEMRREHQVNLSRVEEKRAALELVRIGASPEQLAAADARLQSLKEEQAYYVERVGQAVYTMPFDGTLVTTQLKQKIGSFMDQRESLAVVENNERVVVQIDLPESDVGFVQEGAPVRCRVPAYYDEQILGTVSAIDSTVTEESSERIVRITVQIDNRDRRLKSGMTGYAKVQSEVLPVWRILSLGAVRFFQVEVWSWLP